MDPIALIGNFIIVVALMLLPLYLAKQLVPGPYRLVQRGMKHLGDFAVFRQARRRGLLFSIFVHFFMIVGLVLVLLALLSGTYGALIPGLAFLSITVVAFRVFSALGRLRARRRSLPSWRR
jgi:hypothetical protein